MPVGIPPLPAWGLVCELAPVCPPPGRAGVSNVGEDGNDLGPVDPTCTPFNPFYPSDSPYVLSVSSTFFTPNALPICGGALTYPGPLPLNCDQVRTGAVGIHILPL